MYNVYHGSEEKNIKYIIYNTFFWIHNYENKEKNILNIIIYNVSLLCFHNYVSKNAFARRAIFWFSVTYIMHDRSALLILLLVLLLV